MKQIIEISSFDESIDDKLVIDWINNCFTSDPIKDPSLVGRLLALNRNSLGIKYSEPPFNVNKKFTEKYIKEIFNLSLDQIESLSTEGVKHLNSKILHIFIESGHNLRDKEKSKECNPFFKIYLNTYCRDDRLLCASKPFVSTSMKNTTNPKWETRVDVEVPDSLTQSFDKSLEKIYRQELCIEFWSKKSFTCFERFKKLCSESDQYLGSIFLKIGKRSANENFFTYSIPSNASLQRLSLSNDSIGSVTMKVIWGRLAMKGQHQMCINHHILLYAMSFKWHLNELNQNKEQLEKLMEKTELTHLTFFYMPAVTLHKQHQIQSNLTTYEDCIIRRAVLTTFVIQYSQQNIQFSALLAKLLANEDISRKRYTSWLSNTYIQTLNQIERQFVLQLFESIQSYINLLPKEKFETSQRIQLLFYCLKTFRKYHRKYPDLKLKITINKLIESNVTDWIKDNVNKIDVWPQIISFLTEVSEQLREYWYRLQSIIDPKSIQLIVIDLKYRAVNLTEKWATDKKDDLLSDTILNHFLFITEFTEIFPTTYKRSTSTERETSDTTSTNRDVSPQEKEEKEMEKYLKQIRPEDTTKSIHVQIKWSDLRFSSSLKPRMDESDTQELWGDFDAQIFTHWINKRVENLELFANQMVNTSANIIESCSEDLNDLICGKIATRFFFNSISQLVYFSLAIAAKHYWDYKNFRQILINLCLICYKLCFALKDFYVKKSLSTDSKKGLSLALFCFNTMNVMQKIHLKTDLLELMTDMKASLILKLIKTLKDSEKLSPHNHNHNENSSTILGFCKHVVNVAEEIECFQQDITTELGNQIVKQLYEDINDMINKFPEEMLFEGIEKSLKEKIRFITKNVSEKQMICDIISIVRTKGQKIFVNQLEYIFNFFKSIKTNEKKGMEQKMSETIKMFIQLNNNYINFNQLMISFESELNIETNFGENERKNIIEMGKYMKGEADSVLKN